MRSRLRRLTASAARVLAEISRRSYSLNESINLLIKTAAGSSVSVPFTGRADYARAPLRDQALNQSNGDHVAPEAIALRDEQHVPSPKCRDSFEQHGPVLDRESPRRAAIHEHPLHVEPKT